VEREQNISKFNYILKRLQPYTVAVSRRATSPGDITRLEFFDDGNVLYPGTIYIVPELSAIPALQEAVIYPGSIVLICDERAAGFVESWGKETAILALRCSYRKAYNLLNGILEKYTFYLDFSKKMRRGSISQQQIIQMTEREFQKRFFLLDRDNRLIAGSEQENSDDALRILIQLLSSEKIRQEIGGNPKEPPCDVYADGSGHVGYFRKIYVNQYYFGQLMLLADASDEDDLGTLTLQTAKTIREWLEQSSLRAEETENVMERLLQRVMLRELHDVQDCADAFKALPYPLKKYCQCVLVRFESSVQTKPFSYLLADLEQIFPDTNMTVFRNEVVILLNSEVSRSGLCPEDRLQLERVLHRYAACAAVSSTFFHMCFFHTHYQMMRRLLAIGPAVRFHAEERIFEHEKYSVYLMSEMTIDSYKRQHGHNNYGFLMMTDVINLARYDAENSTNLLYLLHVYLLNNCNINSTAETVFLHRNTVRNRVSQLRSLLTCDLDDPTVQHPLLTSCCLFRYCQQVLNQNLLESHLDREAWSDVHGVSD